RLICVAAGYEGDMKVIKRIVGRRVDGEAPRRSVLEALVHGQDDQLAGAGQAAVVQQTRQVRPRPRAVARVPAQNLLDSRSHCEFLSWAAGRLGATPVELLGHLHVVGTPED